MWSDDDDAYTSVEVGSGWSGDLCANDEGMSNARVAAGFGSKLFCESMVSLRFGCCSEDKAVSVSSGW